MTIRYDIGYTNPAINNVPASMLLSGLNVTLYAMDVKIQGVTRQMEDQTYTVAPHASLPHWVSGYLVVEQATNQVVLLIEANDDDAVPAPYDFSDGVYALLWHLFCWKVPAGTTDLNTLELGILKTEPRAQEQ
jgi:hypothetical protein